jgi:exopolysaccharide biosynthesis polyprenyl glycosylphosphotransferase
LSRKTEILLILLFDFLAINLAWVLHYYLRVESGIIPYTLRPDFLIPMLVISIFWFLVLWFFGLYRPWYAKSRVDELSNIVKAISVGAVLIFFVIFLDDETRGGAPVSSRLLIIGYWFALIVFVGTGRMVVRTVQHKLLERGIGHRRTVIVGDTKRARELLNLIKKHPALGYSVIGLVTQKNSAETIGENGVPVLGTFSKLPGIIREYKIQEVLIALEGKNQEKIVSIIDSCNDIPVGLKILPDMYHIVGGQVRTNQIYGVPLIEVMPRTIQPWEESLKRSIDIAVSSFILVIGLPLWFIIGIAIKLDSPGPVLYRQERVGKDGKIFNIYKFRSMLQDAEKISGPTWADKKDPRITRVGVIIRRLHLDEIPQFINVLNGSMSLIGPRPERPFFVEQFNKQIPLYSRRHAVRPGISGWAQVKHKYDETLEDVKTKLQYDLYYIENMSLRMDLKILLMTVYRVLLVKGH